MSKYYKSKSGKYLFKVTYALPVVIGETVWPKLSNGYSIAATPERAIERVLKSTGGDLWRIKKMTKAEALEYGRKVKDGKIKFTKDLSQLPSTEPKRR